MLLRAVVGLVDLDVAVIGERSACKVQHEVPIQG